MSTCHVLPNHAHQYIHPLAENKTHVTSGTLQQIAPVFLMWHARCHTILVYPNLSLCHHFYGQNNPYFNHCMNPVVTCLIETTRLVWFLLFWVVCFTIFTLFLLCFFHFILWQISNIWWVGYFSFDLFHY